MSADDDVLFFPFVDTDEHLRLRIIVQGQCLEVVLSAPDMDALTRAMTTWQVCHQPQEDPS
jgi:hypothetical protein